MQAEIKALIEAAKSVVLTSLGGGSPEECKEAVYTLANVLSDVAYAKRSLAAAQSAPAEEPKLCGGCRFREDDDDGRWTCINGRSLLGNMNVTFDDLEDSLTIGCTAWERADVGDGKS